MLRERRESLSLVLALCALTLMIYNSVTYTFRKARAYSRTIGLRRMGSHSG